jgi:hypothetical protein
LVVKPQSEKQEVNPMGEKIHPMGYFSKKTTCLIGWDYSIAFGALDWILFGLISLVLLFKGNIFPYQKQFKDIKIRVNKTNLSNDSHRIDPC